MSIPFSSDCEKAAEHARREFMRLVGKMMAPAERKPFPEPTEPSVPLWAIPKPPRDRDGWG
jgi:hypothetical protein